MIAFLLIIVFILFLVFIIGQFSEVKKDIYSFKTNKKFIQDFNPKIDEKVNFWYNEKNLKTYIFLKGTTSGQGKIGETTDVCLKNLILKDVDFDGFISYISENEITIKIKIHEN